jgi:hypothetical protein
VLETRELFLVPAQTEEQINLSEFLDQHALQLEIHHDGPVYSETQIGEYDYQEEEKFGVGVKADYTGVI